MNTSPNRTKTVPQSATGVAFSGYLQSQPAATKFSAVGETFLPKFTRELPRLLWIGDAMVPTGVATVTHALAGRLWKNWNVLESGINCSEPGADLPYPVIPAQRGEDMRGIDPFPELCADFKPDLVVINNDW